MRIVAGTARGRRVAVPAGSTTRPTSDRTREAVFGRLDAWGVVRGADVLDLYCGSGALGLEALSRGAATAVGVDADRAAVRVAADNARSLGLGLQVVHDKVQRWLDSPRAAGAAYDLVLLDPPYDLDEADLAAVLASLAPRVAPDGVVVVERRRRAPEPVWPQPLQALEPRTYGEAQVWFAERPAEEGEK